MIEAYCAALLLLAPSPTASVPEGLLRLERGDAAARAGNYPGALLEYKRAYDHLLPSIRGLDFLETTPAEVIPRSELEERLSGTLDERARSEMRFWDRAMKAFGVLPELMSLEPLMLSLLEGEVAGYYDPERKQITLVDGSVGPPKPPPSSFWARVLGGDQGREFDIDNSRGVIAHELTHALTDQHYDLKKLQQDRRDIDDASMAIDAVIEGDAMIAMMAAMGGDFARSASLFEAGSNYWRLAFNLLADLAPELSGSVLRQAPPFFAKTLMFPYSEGMVFLLDVGERRGYPAVDEVYARPPASTEQVLHPEKYLAGEAPVRLPEPKWPDWRDRGLERLGSNVLGEAQIRYVLDDKTAAAGWGGDRYTLFEGSSGTALVWTTVWDTVRDANEFSNAWRRYVATRLSRDQNQEAPRLPPFLDGELTYRRGDRVFRIRRDDRRVVVLEGRRDQPLGPLMDLAWRVRPVPGSDRPQAP